MILWDLGRAQPAAFLFQLWLAAVSWSVHQLQEGKSQGGGRAEVEQHGALLIPSFHCKLPPSSAVVIPRHFQEVVN